MKKITLLFYIIISLVAFGEVVSYEIDVAYTEVHFTGTPVKAMTLNGGIPGPNLEFTEGDTLRVTFNNKMEVETSIHWHGLLLPNDQDGVPYLTTPPIKPGESFTYEFQLRQHGTYWYHSHTGLQEQRGVYGSIVIHPKNKMEIEEQVVVISDWIDEEPENVMKNLKKDGDYYAVKRDRVQSWDRVIKEGRVGSRILSALMRMGPMDLSDVGYDAYLINGREHLYLEQIPEGTSIKLRIVNAAASSYFFLTYSNGGMKVVAADGKDVVPVEVDEILMGVAETYDVIVKAGGTFRATAQDHTGEAMLHISKAHESSETMDHSMHGMEDKNVNTQHKNHKIISHEKETMEPTMDGDKPAAAMSMGHNMHNMDGEVYYDFLRALEPASYPEGVEEREVILRLTGDMENYVWTFDNISLTESDKIFIKKGEKVRFILENETMMHHPMHLHGHFFRVINKHGNYSPLKHTVDVPPMGRIVIEFQADEEKDWFFHCHNLYHMKTGMSRVVSYEGYELDKDMAKKLSWDRKWFSKGEVTGATNYSGTDIAVFNTRNKIGFSGMASYDGEHDADLYYSRYLNRFLSIGAGFNMEEDDEGEVDNRGFISLEYLLPLLIESEVRFYDDGEVEAEFSSDLQLTKKLQLNWEVDTDGEYFVELEYRYKKWLSFTGNTHSEYDEGIGLKLRF